MSLLEADRLTRRFGDHLALDGFSVTVQAGSIIGVIGPSGGGKTTAIRLLCGLDRPDTGTVSLFGQSALRLERSQRRRLALLAQDPAIVEEMTIGEQVRLSARLRRVDASVVLPVLERVGLSDSEHTRIADASGGMRRRAGLAAALVGDPDLAFLDEPTAGLDPILRERVWRWLRHRRGNGKAMVITTQHIDEAARCDRVIILRAGRVLTDTDPAELAASSGLAEQVVVTLDPVDQVKAVEVLRSAAGAAVETSGGRITIHGDDAPVIAGTVAALLQDAGLLALSIDTVTPGLDAIFQAIVEES